MEIEEPKEANPEWTKQLLNLPGSLTLSLAYKDETSSLTKLRWSFQAKARSNMQWSRVEPGEFEIAYNCCLCGEGIEPLTEIHYQQWLTDRICMDICISCARALC